ncbi:hypothetical protein JXC34_03975 [Candidatus Woesearchaeota archaeon]|nr:hypothetical protein [Candidatus Woesearchaeota archaeon]
MEIPINIGQKIAELQAEPSSILPVLLEEMESQLHKILAEVDFSELPAESQAWLTDRYGSPVNYDRPIEMGSFIPAALCPDNEVFFENHLYGSYPSCKILNEMFLAYLVETAPTLEKTVIRVVPSRLVIFDGGILLPDAFYTLGSKENRNDFWTHKEPELNLDDVLSLRPGRMMDLRQYVNTRLGEEYGITRARVPSYCVVEKLQQRVCCN